MSQVQVETYQSELRTYYSSPIYVHSDLKPWTLYLMDLRLWNSVKAVDEVHSRIRSVFGMEKYKQIVVWMWGGGGACQYVVQPMLAV
jgi:hypothetical protein